MSDYAAIEKEARIFTEECVTNNRIDPTLFAQYDIKRGLRDKRYAFEGAAYLLLLGDLPARQKRQGCAGGHHEHFPHRRL